MIKIKTFQFVWDHKTSDLQTWHMGNPYIRQSGTTFSERTRCMANFCMTPLQVGDEVRAA